MKAVKKLVVNKILACILALAMIFSALVTAAISVSADVYELKWSDEFDGQTINPNNWTFDLAHRNNEKQTYTTDNATVKHGKLVIKGECTVVDENKNPTQGRQKETGTWNSLTRLKDVRSSSIQSVGKQAFKFGKVEIRAKLTNALSSWPAFWTCGWDKYGMDPSTGGSNWPSNGEIDFMEFMCNNSINELTSDWKTTNKDKQYEVHLHSGPKYLKSNPTECWDGKASGDRGYADATIDPGNVSNGSKQLAADWHTYGMIWEENSIKITFDGVVQMTINTSNAALLASAAKKYGATSSAYKAYEDMLKKYGNPFNDYEHYFLINLAIGGGATTNYFWGSEWPQYLMVDYIRVYQKNDGVSTHNKTIDAGTQYNKNGNIYTTYNLWKEHGLTKGSDFPSAWQGSDDNIKYGGTKVAEQDFDPYHGDAIIDPEESSSSGSSSSGSSSGGSGSGGSGTTTETKVIDFDSVTATMEKIGTIAANNASGDSTSINSGKSFKTYADSKASVSDFNTSYAALDISSYIKSNANSLSFKSLAVHDNTGTALAQYGLIIDGKNYWSGSKANDTNGVINNTVQTISVVGKTLYATDGTSKTITASDIPKITKFLVKPTTTLSKIYVDDIVIGFGESSSSTTTTTTTGGSGNTTGDVIIDWDTFTAYEKEGSTISNETDCINVQKKGNNLISVYNFDLTKYTGIKFTATPNSGNVKTTVELEVNGVTKSFTLGSGTTECSFSFSEMGVTPTNNSTIKLRAPLPEGAVQANITFSNLYDITAGPTEPTPPECYQIANVATADNWVPGNWDMNNGNLDTSYANRAALDKIVAVEYGKTYTLSLGSNAGGLAFVVREYDSNGDFLRNGGTVLSGNDYTPSSQNVSYISLTLYNDKDNAYTYISNGTTTPYMVVGPSLEYYTISHVSTTSNWVLGSWDPVNDKLNFQNNRPALNKKVQVTPGTEYKLSLSNSTGLSFNVVEYKADGSFKSNAGNVASNATYTPSDSNVAYISLTVSSDEYSNIYNGTTIPSMTVVEKYYTIEEVSNAANWQQGSWITNNTSIDASVTTAAALKKKVAVESGTTYTLSLGKNTFGLRFNVIEYNSNDTFLRSCGIVHSGNDYTPSDSNVAYISLTLTIRSDIFPNTNVYTNCISNGTTTPSMVVGPSVPYYQPSDVSTASNWVFSQLDPEHGIFNDYSTRTTLNKKVKVTSGTTYKLILKNNTDLKFVIREYKADDSYKRNAGTVESGGTYTPSGSDVAYIGLVVFEDAYDRIYGGTTIPYMIEFDSSPAAPNANTVTKSEVIDFETSAKQPTATDIDSDGGRYEGTNDTAVNSKRDIAGESKKFTGYKCNVTNVANGAYLYKVYGGLYASVQRFAGSYGKLDINSFINKYKATTLGGIAIDTKAISLSFRAGVQADIADAQLDSAGAVMTKPVDDPKADYGLTIGGINYWSGYSTDSGSTNGAITANVTNEANVQTIGIEEGTVLYDAAGNAHVLTKDDIANITDFLIKPRTIYTAVYIDDITINYETTYQVAIDEKVKAYRLENREYTLPEPADTIKNFIAYEDESANVYYDKGETITVDKNYSFTTLDFGPLQMLEGASVRLNWKTGIRFYTPLSEPQQNMIQSLRDKGMEVKLATLIAPADYLTKTGEELTLKFSMTKLDVEYDYINNPYFTESNGFEGIVGSITSIKEKNYARNFVGRSYAKITIDRSKDGVHNTNLVQTIYADYAGTSGNATPNVANNSRSVAYLAYRYKNDLNSDYSKLKQEHKALVDTWASKHQ